MKDKSSLLRGKLAFSCSQYCHFSPYPTMTTPSPLKRKPEDSLEAPETKRVSKAEPVKNCVQIPRTLSGEIEVDFTWPITVEQQEAHYAKLMAAVPAWQAKHADTAALLRRKYIEACPAKKGDEDSIAAYVADWTHKDETNGGIIYLEWPDEIGGFDGDRHFGNDLSPPWGIREGVERWMNGEGWSPLHDPSAHMEELRTMIDEWDAEFAEMGYGPAIYLTKELYDRREEGGTFSQKEELQLEFAEQVQDLLDEIYDDCLEHKLLTMSAADHVYFCAMLSRFPIRPDDGMFVL